MRFTDEVIGAKLLESITGGLYDGNPNCIREYVQNAVDHGAKNIEIRQEMRGRSIVVRDDGPGMNAKDIVKALSIGVSEKDETMAGWRGIGIWSGVPACERLVFITKKCGHPKIRVIVDNEKLRGDYETNIPISSVFLNDITDPIEEPLGKGESIEKTHFTEVRLESILPTQESYYTTENLKNFLQMVVPAPFDETKFKFANEINEWLSSNGVKYRMPNIFFNGKKIVRAPFNADDYYQDVIKPVFCDDNSNVKAVGWILSLKQRAKSKWPKTGILFKKKGFTIGKENTLQQYFTGTFHQWQYGEIHIIDKDVRENSARDGFEYNHGRIQDFLNWIKTEAANWENINRVKVDIGKTDKIKNIRQSIKSGNIRKAKKDLKELEEKIKKPRSYPKAEYLQSLKPHLEQVRSKNLSELSEIKEQIKQIDKEGKSDSLQQLRDMYWTMVDSSYPTPMKQDVKRVRKGHEGDLVIAAFDTVEKQISAKTGLKEAKFIDLTRKAFGWNEVTALNNPKITIDASNKASNRQFGVMIYALYNLFENKFKHEKELETFKWYRDATEEGKLLFRIQLNSIVHFCYRMIESTQASE